MPIAKRRVWNKKIMECYTIVSYDIWKNDNILYILFLLASWCMNKIDN